jgi:uncharacterized protein
MTQLFAITAWDAPGAETIRSATRAAHLMQIETIMEKIAVAGPLKTDNGGFVGSLLIVKAADRAEALAILESDPYFRAGVWNRWEINPFVAAAGQWPGGKIW